MVSVRISLITYTIARIKSNCRLRAWSVTDTCIYRTQLLIILTHPQFLEVHRGTHCHCLLSRAPLFSKSIQNIPFVDILVRNCQRASFRFVRVSAMCSVPGIYLKMSISSSSKLSLMRCTVYLKRYSCPS